MEVTDGPTPGWGPDPRSMAWTLPPSLEHKIPINQKILQKHNETQLLVCNTQTGPVHYQEKDNSSDFSLTGRKF